MIIYKEAIHDSTEFVKNLLYNTNYSKGEILMEHLLKKEFIQNSIAAKHEAAFLVPALLIGLVPDPWTICFVFPYLTYAFMKNARGWIYAMAGILIAGTAVNVVNAYMFAVLFSAFCLCIQIIKFMERNIYQALTGLCTMLCIPYLLALPVTLQEGVIILGFTALYTYLVQTGYHWTKKTCSISKAVYPLLLYALFLLIMPWIPEGYQFGTGMVILTLAALSSNREEVCLILLFQFLMTPFPIGSPWLVLLACLSIYQGRKLFQLIFITIAAMFLATNSSAISVFIIMMILTLLYKERLLPFLAEDREPISISQNLALRDMNLKLHNFSAIFDALSNFYMETSDIQGEMLQNMSQALSYTAAEMRVNTDYDDRRLKILDALEGYQYEVEDLLFEEMENGNIHIEVTIRNIKRDEIKTTLIPLLEVLVKSRLVIADDQTRKFHKACHHIVLDSAVPYYIDAYADSLKNISDKSGDCFSIYRYRQNVVCMISDGMGHGSKAAQASHLITDIFQRMMSSGIAQDRAICCINRLLQSDTYATLDVITFDRMRGAAYISKAAACPTYLIRAGELHEISSSALPVGIIASSEPDYFIVELQEEDVFLMASDGVYMDEIMSWMKNREKGSAKEQINCFMDILKKQIREDDSTILLAQVTKSKN